MQTILLIFSFFLSTTTLQATSDFEWQGAPVFDCDDSAEAVEILPNGPCTTQGEKKCQSNKNDPTQGPLQSECKTKGTKKPTELIWKEYNNKTKECDELTENLPQSGTTCGIHAKKICQKDNDKKSRTCAEFPSEIPRCYFEDGNESYYLDENNYRNRPKISWDSTNAEDGLLECSKNGVTIVHNERVKKKGSFYFDRFETPGKVRCRMILGQGNGGYSQHSCEKSFSLRNKSNCEFEVIPDTKKGGIAHLKWTSEKATESSLSCKRDGKFIYQTPLGRTFQASDEYKLIQLNQDGNITCSLSLKDGASNIVEHDWTPNSCEIQFKVLKESVETPSGPSCSFTPIGNVDMGSPIPIQWNSRGEKKFRLKCKQYETLVEIEGFNSGHLAKSFTPGVQLYKKIGKKFKKIISPGEATCTLDLQEENGNWKKDACEQKFRFRGIIQETNYAPVTSCKFQKVYKKGNQYTINWIGMNADNSHLTCKQDGKTIIDKEGFAASGIHQETITTQGQVRCSLDMKRNGQTKFLHNRYLGTGRNVCQQRFEPTLSEEDTPDTTDSENTNLDLGENTPNQETCTLNSAGNPVGEIQIFKTITNTDPNQSIVENFNEVDITVEKFSELYISRCGDQDLTITQSLLDKIFLQTNIDANDENEDEIGN